MNYPQLGDFKYHSTDRQYSNGSVANGEYLDRRNDLASGSISQSMNIAAGNNEIDYNATHLQHETPCNTSGSLILTPPQSGDEVSSSATNPPSSSFTYSTLPKVSGSNVPGPQYYPSNGTAFLPSSFHGTNMTQFGQRGALQIPAPLSPPYNYGPVNSSNFPSFNTMSRGFGYDNLIRRSNGPYDLLRPPLPLGSLSATVPYTSMHPPPPPRPEGPPFEDIHIIHSLIGSRNHSLNIDILASIPKGFFRVDDKWTCYRRNYFSVSCGFAIKSHCPDGQAYIQRYSHSEQVQGYAVSISARTAVANNSESETRGLVQHTPKRDKATESVPTRHVVVPTPSQNLGNGHSLPLNGLYSTSSLTATMHTSYDALGQPTVQAPQTNYTFERIQFQKATANNGKRRAQQQYFHVVVKLEVNIGRLGGPDDWVLIATKQSHPMVVRGRSPGHYKDARRESQSSMGPDSGSHSGDGGSSGFSTHPFGPTHLNSLNGATSQYRSSHHYSTSYPHSSHRPNEVDGASVSPGSSTTLGSSPNKGDNYFVSYSTSRTTLPEANFERIVLNPVLTKTHTDTMEYHPTKKTAFRDDASECTNPFYHASLEPSYHNPSFDFSATSSSQALCASS